MRGSRNLGALPSRKRGQWNPKAWRHFASRLDPSLLHNFGWFFKFFWHLAFNYERNFSLFACLIFFVQYSKLKQPRHNSLTKSTWFFYHQTFETIYATVLQNLFQISTDYFPVKNNEKKPLEGLSSSVCVLWKYLYILETLWLKRWKDIVSLQHQVSSYIWYIKCFREDYL